MTEAKSVTSVAPYAIVDDEYRTGVLRPEWWTEAANGRTVFVADVRKSNKVKDASLREHARREGARLHTKKAEVGGEAGTLYWMTFPAGSTAPAAIGDHDHAVSD